MKFLNILFSISLLVSLINFNTGSNLKLKEPYVPSGMCKSEWTYRGTTYHRCDKTPDKSTTWCYVVNSDKKWTWCDQSPKSHKGFYVESGTCKYEWQYRGRTYYGCDKTFDTQNSWCIVDKWESKYGGDIQGDIWTWCKQKVQACSK